MSESLMTNTDTVASLAAAASDSNTITVAADEYVEWYGTTFSQGLPATTTGEMQCSVEIGSTEVAVGVSTKVASLPTDGGFTLSPPAGRHVQGAAGEDLVIKMENIGASNAINDLYTTSFYLIRKVTKGN